MFDFDGSLSPIVDDPAAARPAPGVVDRLAVLAEAYRRVAVVSGRPVAFLAAHLPEGVDLSGLYGLESRLGGVTREADGVGAWRSVVADAAAQARTAGIDGLGVEEKGLSLTLHYRTRPELGAEAEALADALASASGLVRRGAKMSVELHPPVTADKGTAVRELVGDARGVLYLGDDVGDLPAFDALDELATEGRTVVPAVVATCELPDALRARAALVLDGQAGVLALLAELAPER